MFSEFVRCGSKVEASSCTLFAIVDGRPAGLDARGGAATLGATGEAFEILDIVAGLGAATFRLVPFEPPTSSPPL